VECKPQAICHFDVLMYLQGMALSMGDKINLSQKKNKVDIAK